jgi:hypothetical protein
MKYDRVLIYDDGRVQINRRFHRQPTRASMSRLLDVLGTTTFYGVLTLSASLSASIYRVDRTGLREAELLSTLDYEDNIADRDFIRKECA